MSRSPTELFEYLFGVSTPGATLDARPIADDEGFYERASEAIADDAEILFTVPGGGPGFADMSGPFAGAAGYRAGWREWLSSWAEWTFTIEEFTEIDGDRVLLLAQCFGRMARSDVSLEAPGAALHTARGGRFVKIEFFLDHDQARRAAGLD